MQGLLSNQIYCLDVFLIVLDIEHRFHNQGIHFNIVFQVLLERDNAFNKALAWSTGKPFHIEMKKQLPSLLFLSRDTGFLPLQYFIRRSVCCLSYSCALYIHQTQIIAVPHTLQTVILYTLFKIRASYCSHLVNTNVNNQLRGVRCVGSSLFKHALACTRTAAHIHHTCSAPLNPLLCVAVLRA
jgi:hypothetical protein